MYPVSLSYFADSYPEHETTFMSPDFGARAVVLPSGSFLDLLAKQRRVEG